MHGVENGLPSGGRGNPGHTAVILLGHGSRAAEANEGMYKVVKSLQKNRPEFRFSAAFLEINTPSIPEGIDICVAEGAKRIILLPYFLHLGNHVQKDLPEYVKKSKQLYPDVIILLSSHLGFHEKLVEIADERLFEALEIAPATILPVHREASEIRPLVSS